MNTIQRQQTDRLIARLASKATAVKRLPSPHLQMFKWFSVSLVYVAIVVMIIGVRADILSKLHDFKFTIEVMSALVTSMFAAAAAFCAGCPGRPLWERFTPLPALAIWIGSLALGCWQYWLAFGSGAMYFQPDMVCYLCIFLIGLLPGILILFMIKKGTPIAPTTTVAFATMAAAALGAAALRLFYVEDSSPILLTSQFGAVLTLTLLGALMGRIFLLWPHETANLEAGPR